MTVSQLSLLVLLILVGFAHGAPTQYASTQTDNCSWWKYVRDDVKCLPETLTFGMDFASKLDRNMDKESELNAMYEACIPFLKCFATTECLSTEFEKLKVACDLIVYTESPRFFECERKMKRYQSYCPKGNECDIFGENNCMADVMKEACGRDEWVRYRDLVWKSHRISGDAEKCYNKQFENL